MQRLKGYIKSVKEDWLQPSKTVQTTQASTVKNKKTVNKNGKKKNCIDISSDKRNLTRENKDMTKK